jgi:thymidine phosphorylase
MQLIHEEKLSKKQVDFLIAEANAAQIAQQQAAALLKANQEQ